VFARVAPPSRLILLILSRDLTRGSTISGFNGSWRIPSRVGSLTIRENKGVHMWNKKAVYVYVYTRDALNGLKRIRPRYPLTDLKPICRCTRKIKVLADKDSLAAFQPASAGTNMEKKEESAKK